MRERSRYLPHADADPELSIVLITTVVGAPGRDTTVALVQLFRIRDGTMPSSATTSHQASRTEARVANEPDRVGDPSPWPLEICPGVSARR